MKLDLRGATVLLLIFSFGLTGCATIFSGTSDQVTIETSPAGALVQIDGVDRGRTPLTTSVKRSIGGADIMLSLDGYETRNFSLGQEFNMTAIANVLCIWGIVVCGGIDVLTGAIMKYDPRTYTMELRPRSDLEEDLDVEEVLFEDELERDAFGFPNLDQVRPNVALVNPATKQIVVFR